MPRQVTPIEVRFWKYVSKTDGCWLWSGAKTFGGYGVLNQFGRIVRAHRLSWEMHNGRTIPEGMDICHTCDNPPCVNPDHLFLGTPKINAEDKRLKGRARGPANAKGMRHNQAKLTDDAVRSIRSGYASGDTSYRRLAREFGVTHKLVIQIVKRRMWTHI